MVCDRLFCAGFVIVFLAFFGGCFMDAITFVAQPPIPETPDTIENNPIAASKGDLKKLINDRGYPRKCQISRAPTGLLQI